VAELQDKLAEAQHSWNNLCEQPLGCQQRGRARSPSCARMLTPSPASPPSSGRHLSAGQPRSQHLLGGDVPTMQRAAPPFVIAGSMRSALASQQFLGTAHADMAEKMMHSPVKASAADSTMLPWSPGSNGMGSSCIARPRSPSPCGRPLLQHKQVAFVPSSPPSGMRTPQHSCRTTATGSVSLQRLAGFQQQQQPQQQHLAPHQLARGGAALASPLANGRRTSCGLSSQQLS